MTVNPLAELPVWWYLARATGIVALFAMGSSVALGVFLSTRLLPDRRRPAWLLDSHRWLSGIAVLSLATHLGSLVADTYLTFGWRELLLPQASEWRPFAVTLGVLSLWFLVAGTLAAILRRRLSRRVWLVLHRLTYVSFWLSCLHAGLAGTDASNPVYRVLSIGMIVSVAFLALYRLLVTEPPKRSTGHGARGMRPVRARPGAAHRKAASGATAEAGDARPVTASLGQR